MHRQYLQHEGRSLHLLAGGRGPAALVLHGLPGEARRLRALCEALEARCGVCAPDLPGHGLSDPCSTEPRLDLFVEALRRLVEALGLASFCIVALQESAPIALALAESLGDRVAKVVLVDPYLPRPGDDGPELAARYPPEASGAHLTRLWDAVRARHIFRPFHRQTAAARMRRALPDAETLNAEALAWLRAGPDPLGGLRAVVRDGLAQAAHPRSPLTILRMGGGPDPRIPGARLLDCEPDALGTMILAEIESAACEPWSMAADLSPEAGGPDGFSRRFVPVRGGQIHLRARWTGSGRPLVALHDPAGTSELVLPFAAPLAAERPVIAIDLPGNGESDNVLGTSSPTSADYACVVAETLDALGVDEVDVIGRYSGGPVGMELGFLRPRLLKRLVQAGVTTYAPEEAARLLERYTPPVTPTADGAHLARAWHMMKSQALFWPWFDQTAAGVIAGEPQLDPQLLHRRVVDLLKCGSLYAAAYAALWTYPLEERLPEFHAPCLLCAPRWDPLFTHLPKAVSVAGPNCQQAVLPDRFADWAGVIGPFLAGHAPENPS